MVVTVVTVVTEPWQKISPTISVLKGPLPLARSVMNNKMGTSQRDHATQTERRMSDTPAPYYTTLHVTEDAYCSKHSAPAPKPARLCSRQAHLDRFSPRLFWSPWGIGS